MPTVLRVRNLRFHFYSDEDRSIPPHQLREIERLVYENEQLLLEKVNEYHSYRQ